MIGLVILVCVSIGIVFLFKKAKPKSKTVSKTYPKPNSAENEDLEDYNETLENNMQVIIAGTTLENVQEFMKEQHIIYDQGEDFFIVEEVRPEVIRITFKSRWYVPYFYEFVLSCNKVSEREWKSKAITWLSIPFMSKEGPKAVPSMVYTLLDTDESALYITTCENICWRISTVYMEYDKTILRQEYRNPPV